MKRRFVKISLMLCMLLILAAPVQALALDKNCSIESLNQFTNCSKIYTQISQESLQSLLGNCSRIISGELDQTQLQNLFQQCGLTVNSEQTSSDDEQQAAAAPAAAPAETAQTTTTNAAPAAAPAETAQTTTSSNATTEAIPAKTTTTTSTAASSNLGSYEQQVVDLVNKERAAAGLSALTVNTKLANVAETKAADLRDENYFSHTSPIYGSPFDMMKQFGISYTAAGENIAKGQRTPEEVMNGWMNSQGHRENILNANFTEIGVGYVTDSNGTGYWVQEFIRP